MSAAEYRTQLNPVRGYGRAGEEIAKVWGSRRSRGDKPPHETAGWQLTVRRSCCVPAVPERGRSHDRREGEVGCHPDTRRGGRHGGLQFANASTAPFVGGVNPLRPVQLDDEGFSPPFGDVRKSLKDKNLSPTPPTLSGIWTDGGMKAAGGRSSTPPSGEVENDLRAPATWEPRGGLDESERVLWETLVYTPGVRAKRARTLQHRGA